MKTPDSLATSTQSKRRAQEAIASHRFDEAQRIVDEVLSSDPVDLDALNLKGVLFAKLGRANEALQVFDQAISLAPRSFECHYNRGSLLQAIERHGDAIESFHHALAQNPESPETLNNLGISLNALARFSEAEQIFDKALALRPDFALALNNRGIAQAGLRRFGAAIASYSAAISVQPDYADAYANRGVARTETLALEGALADFATARKLRPNPAIEMNEAIVLLLAGDFEKGLEKFEWRPEGSARASEAVSKLQWKGEDLVGKTILLRAEQGLGDTIQFCRYASMLEQRGARVVLDVQPQLKPLLSGLVGPAAIIARGEKMPSFQVHCSLMGLPFRFRTRLTNIPSSVPYLRADPQRAEIWRRKLARKEGDFIVGIAWAGRQGAIDSGRSIPLRSFASLAGVRGVRLVSLQKEVGLEQLNESGAPPVEDLGDFDPPGSAFLDSAAIMENLDLIITSDTAIAHLAGALARPVWTALKFAPDWRWLLGRSDSPWYPTMRLFRQERIDDWDGVFANIADALRQTVPA